MKRFEQRYTDLLASNSFVALLVAFSAAGLYALSLKLPAVPTFHWTVNLAGIIAALGGIVYINRTHLLLHSSMKLYIGVALLILAALPSASLSLCYGTLMAVVMVWILAVLYSSYKEKRVSRRIYLIFAVVSACSLVQHAFVAYLPVIFLGCTQMRCLNLRNFCAALFGIITPFWIVLGFGIITPQQLCLPPLAWPDVSHILAYTTPQLVVIALALLIAIVDTLTNVLKVFYGFNARTRAFNGVLALLTLWTAACAVVDFDNLNAYITLLSILAAMQLTLHFALSIGRRAYISISIVLLLFISMDIWNLIIR